MNQDQEFVFDGQAEEKASNYIAANSVNICTVSEVTYHEQWNRINFVLTTDKGQAGKGSFSLSDNTFGYVLALVASIANKSGRGAEMTKVFPGGKCDGCSREEWVTKVASVINGAKVAMLFGGRQYKGNWYAELQLFGSIAPATEDGVQSLETKRAALQNNAKFMVKEEVPSTEVSENEVVDY